MTERRRSSWRFSLQSLFVVVTVCCCWLAWQSHVVRARRDVIRQLRAQAGLQITTAAEWEARFPAGGAPTKVARIPVYRRLLGDEAIQYVSVYTWNASDLTPEDMQRAVRLLSEAEFHEVQPEPCHPGCFPWGTLVETDEGRRPIEQIQVGDTLQVFLADGTPSVARVQSIFATRNWLWQVETDDGLLVTTETQPLCLGTDTVRAAGQLQPGDQILSWRDGELQLVRVERVVRSERFEPVINLVLGDCQLFVAGGYLARSKPPAPAADPGARADQLDRPPPSRPLTRR